MSRKNICMLFKEIVMNQFKSILLVFLVLVMSGCQGESTLAPHVPEVVVEADEAVEEVTGAETKVEAVEGAEAKDVVVVLSTSMGDIEIELNAAKAPITVANFLSYVDKKHYDGVIFHRVIPNFMIQTGGMNADMSERATGSQIQNEAANGLRNLRGTISMARTGMPHSATAQFFINVENNRGLNYRGADRANFGYCVFGKVVSGMDVVDKIRAVETGNRKGHGNVPLEPITLKQIRRK